MSGAADPQLRALLERVEGLELERDSRDNALDALRGKVAILEGALPEDQLAQNLFFINAEGKVGGGSAPTGPAGGVLTGTYPNPGLATPSWEALQNQSANFETVAGFGALETALLGGMIYMRGLFKAKAEIAAKASPFIAVKATSKTANKRRFNASLMTEAGVAGVLSVLAEGTTWTNEAAVPAGSLVILEGAGPISAT